MPSRLCSLAELPVSGLARFIYLIREREENPTVEDYHAITTAPVNRINAAIDELVKAGLLKSPEDIFGYEFGDVKEDTREDYHARAQHFWENWGPKGHPRRIEKKKVFEWFVKNKVSAAKFRQIMLGSKLYQEKEAEKDFTYLVMPMRFLRNKWWLDYEEEIKREELKRFGPKSKKKNEDFTRFCRICLTAFLRDYFPPDDWLHNTAVIEKLFLKVGSEKTLHVVRGMSKDKGAIEKTWGRPDEFNLKLLESYL